MSLKINLVLYTRPPPEPPDPPDRVPPSQSKSPSSTCEAPPVLIHRFSTTSSLRLKFRWSLSPNITDLFTRQSNCHLCSFTNQIYVSLTPTDICSLMSPSLTGKVSVRDEPSASYTSSGIGISTRVLLVKLSHKDVACFSARYWCGWECIVVYTSCSQASLSPIHSIAKSWGLDFWCWYIGSGIVCGYRFAQPLQFGCIPPSGFRLPGSPGPKFSFSVSLRGSPNPNPVSITRKSHRSKHSTFLP